MDEVGALGGFLRVQPLLWTSSPVFSGGFAAEGFKAKIFDVPGMQHDTANGPTL
jgi:hypothetical protein